jgi:Cofilin/tropomyosin-type actin-binding protein
LTKKAEVKSQCGEVHAEVQIESKDGCTVDHFVEVLSKSMVMDSGGKFSISKIKEDYEAMIARSKTADAGGGDILKRAEKTRKTAAEMGSVKAEKVLEAVRKPLGPFNWALFRAGTAKALDFFNAGSMSVMEMQKWLKDDEVLVGLLRMGFGTGKLRRVKWICVHWSGDKVSPVKRGRAVAATKDLARALEPFSLTISASSAEDLSLAAIIDKVRRSVVVDGESHDADKDGFSIEEFLKSLREETAASADFFGDAAPAVPGEIPLAETVADIRDPDGKGVNWMLLQLE